MKKSRPLNVFTLCMIFFLILFTGCTDDSNPVESVPEPSLLGTWDINSMEWDFQGETGSYSKAQLDSIGLIWSLSFNEDSTAGETTNISGPLLTMTGTWAKSKTQLMLTLNHPSGGSGTILYDYKFEDEILILQWQIPAGTVFRAEFLNREANNG